jgi:hypothetical protein
MSLKLNYASLSLGAAVDQQTGNLSIFEIVEEIRTPQIPIQLQNLVISLSLQNMKAVEFRGKIFIHVLTPDGKQALVGNGDIICPVEQKRLRAVFRFGGFPITAFGQHRFVLSWVDQAGAKIGEAILDWEVMQVQQVAQGVAPQDKPPVSH